MSLKRSGWTLVEFWLACTLLLAGLATIGTYGFAQSVPVITTTRVADTVYRADGTAATGTVLVSWPAFSTVTGASVPAGSTSVTIGTGGSLSVNLVPNAGSTPMGSYYTVVYHLDDGRVTREYWVVPASGGTIAVGAIRSTVLPASVAMQTVSKSYVDTAIAAAVTGHPLDTSTPYVVKSGDTMTGPLVLPADPTSSLQASDKHYVDTQVAALASGLDQKVSLLPQGTQTVSQPVGTSLEVNRLNAVEQAGQYVSGGGNNGIANAAATPDCVGGCSIAVEQTYPQTEHVNNAVVNNQTHIADERGGAVTEHFFNPLPLLEGGLNVARSIDVISTQSAQSVLAATGGSEIFSTGLQITNDALAGGSNVYPALIQGTTPYFKTTYTGLSVTGNNNTLGQHVLFTEQQNCYGVGDCLLGGMFLQASGGFRDDADEGTHPFDRTFTEDPRVFTGTCALNCVPGATSVKVAATTSAGTQGEGRYLLDTNPAKLVTSGTITGGAPSGNRQPTATFAGTAFPVSTFLETAQTVPTQAMSINPGTVNVGIVTNGVPAGFATNTAALPAASGVACVSDIASADARPLNFETAAYTVVDGSHLRLTLYRPHASGATIAVGGLCGYGLEQTVDTINGIRQVFPVIGSDSPTSLLYAGGLSALVGVQGQTSAYTNVNLVVASIVRNNNVVTVTTSSNFGQDVAGLAMTVANVTDASYNGRFVVTTTGPNTLTYANNGSNSTSSGGTLSLLTGGFVLYPMAEVQSVYNPASKAVDGLLTLAANTVNWAAGDTVEQPHYFQEWVSDDTDIVTQYTPRAARYQSAGIYYGGNNSAGLFGWQIENGDPATSYFGNGGTHTVPNVGMNIRGVWRHSMEMQAGEDAAIEVHCNAHGCDKWNSGYDLFQMDTSVGADRVHYSPSNSNLTFALRGTNFQFTPLGFTANTINATTLNAGSIHGQFVGTVGASSLPLFGASGSSHQLGAVPDPGASAGTTRFLREDGTWSVPAGGGGGLIGPAVLPQASSLIGEYLLMEGSGTTMHDSSGNGNDAFLPSSGLAPAWTPAGLAFSPSKFVNLPPALNTAQTMLFALYINPLSTPANHIQGFPLLVTNTVGNTDFQLILEHPYPGLTNNDFMDSAFGADIFAGGSVTASGFSTSGFHTLAVTLGTCGASVDHLYFDGQEVDYTVQGCSAGKQTAGNLILGANDTVWGGNSGLRGQVYLAAFYSVPLSADDVIVASGLVRNAVAARGVAVEQRPSTQTVSALHIAGDSITFGYPNLTPYSALLSLANPPASIVNWGISGLTVEAIQGSEPNRVGPLCHTTMGPATYTIFAGTNDLYNITAATTVSTYAQLTGLIQIMKTAGCRLGVATMISRTGNGNSNGGAPMDADKKAYNALILGGARAAGADFVIDLAADPNLGADGAFANATYFAADGVHPTQAGQQEIANVFSNAYNYAFGHTRTNPAVVAASTYQMLSGDGAVALTAASAQAITLPDCTGPSGAVYTLNNSTGIAKSVVGRAGQPINGLTSAVAIPANSSLTLIDVPNPETASGCHWEY